MAKHLVEFYESERGWGSETWLTEYDTYEQAVAVVYECNYKYMGKDTVPDYYTRTKYLGEK